MKLLTLAIVLIPFVLPFAQDGIFISVKTMDYPYADSHIADKLSLALSPFKEVQISKACNLSGSPEGLDELIAFGRAHNVRFLAELSIDKMDLKKQKKTIIPLALFRYRVYGAIAGTLRIIDIAKERIIQLENVNADIEAADQWQIFDDDASDPALNIPADEKIALFDRLEDEVARQFWEKIRRLTRGNSFGG